MDDNPYAAPQADVLEVVSQQPLSDWSARRLQGLGWLSVLNVLGSLLLLLLMLLSEEGDPAQVWSGADGLSLALVLTGSYLLLCFMRFIQARFAAQGLHWPVGLILISGLLLELIDLTQGAALFSQLNWQSISYVVLMMLYGAGLLWLGVRLLRVTHVYPVLRWLAWLDIAGGVLLLTVLGGVLAVLPLLGSSLALTAVFWRGAREQRALHR